METEDCISYPDGKYRYDIELYDGTVYCVVSQCTPFEDVQELSMLRQDVWYTFTVDYGRGRTGAVSIRVADIKAVTWPHPREDDGGCGYIDPRCDIGQTYTEIVTDEE